VDHPQLPVTESASHLMIALPATLVAILALSYALHRVLRDKAPGFLINAALLAVGMAAGVALMSFGQALL
jgi:hypothetical protein